MISSIETSLVVESAIYEHYSALITLNLREKCSILYTFSSAICSRSTTNYLLEKLGHKPAIRRFDLIAAVRGLVLILCMTIVKLLPHSFTNLAYYY